MKFTRRWFCLFLLLLMTGCAVKPPPQPRERIEPLIRVGLVWGKHAIEFSANNSFQITSHDGTFIARGMKGKRWRAEVKASVRGKIVYRLVAGSMSTKERARVRAKEIAQKGFDTVIQIVGQPLRIGGRLVNDNRSYRVYLRKTFESEEAAKLHRDSIWNRLETFVTQQEIQKTKGTILLKNLENGQQFESSKPILVRKASVTLYDIPVGVGYHWERQETRNYPEIICFDIGRDGKLAVINILPLEEYVRGVVPSEMPQGFPLEALKAQAVAARGEVLAKLGLSHSADPFDICADVHCQVYSGLSKRAPSTDRAVQETKGLVLWKEGRICNAVYSAVCGGHGEDVDNAWGGQPKSYLRGDFDGPGRLKRYGSLSDEKNLKRWIDDNPPAYCNTARGRTLKALEYTKKYFRWEVRYTQEELRKIVQEKTDQNVGEILDLVPLERGVSGRIIRLKIVGKKGGFILERELKIRKALSRNTLWSSCFYVLKKGRRGRVPREFVLRGAGWGHGVGMCQTGAAMMALKGKRFHEILKHYYRGVQIRQLY